ncbi:hypothetical protein [Virgisporangium aurantiacum]|uniref:Uncharacterized protein n=1 Tax=Virgisporangium aurantiacum TaxID=175570 RepID=A0A8J4E3L9_9ACTN|nr:hypothetical protein [Virgisporangium aurantiacum]GIJ61015.1 hypothetical protein Vau01_085310 [Virgisporangium aurantiacum]
MVIVAYALAAGFCRPLTVPALAAVLLVGVPLVWLGVRRAPAVPAVSGRTVAVWSGVAAVGVALELALRLGPNNTAWPTLSTLLDPLLETYPGRVAGYLLWLGAGAWLVRQGQER